jgi:MFS family permease
MSNQAPAVPVNEGNAALDWDRWYVLLLLTVAYALNVADRYVVNTLIEPIKHEFGLSDLGVGLLTGTAVALFYCSASVPMAIWGDRRSRKPIIVLAVSVWSLLTLLSGMSGTFWQFFAARLGVGIGEAGATPISQSLLSDKFPPRLRSFVFTLFVLGAAAGAAAGASLGGFLSDKYGWRAALMIFGAFGFPLAFLIAMSVKEPMRGRFDQRHLSVKPSLSSTLHFMMKQRSLRHLFIGSSVVTFWSWGLIWWTPTFLLRSRGMSLGDGGSLLGLIHGLGGVVVTLATAGVMKLFADKDPRYPLWFVGVTTCIATIPAFFAYWTNSTALSMSMLWFYISVTYTFSGPSYALAQNLVPADMRSQSCALILLTANVTNLILAPVVVGFASDMVAPHLTQPDQALRYVLAGGALTGFWGAWHYFKAAAPLREDLVRAGVERSVSV